MLKINKVITNELRRKFEVVGNDELYSLSLENKIIGYGIIRENTDNNIEIYILKEYQGEGYGSYLFKDLLNRISGIVKLKVELDNSIMQQIILNNHGKEIGRDGENVYYIVKN